VKDGWDPIEYCPGGCGYIHRQCCDSVLGSDHQSICQGLPSYVGDPAPRRLEQFRRRAVARIRAALVMVAGLTICLELSR
jgi:hypothetical protein